MKLPLHPEKITRDQVEALTARLNDVEAIVRAMVTQRAPVDPEYDTCWWCDADLLATAHTLDCPWQRAIGYVAEHPEDPT